MTTLFIWPSNLVLNILKKSKKKFISLKSDNLIEICEGNKTIKKFYLEDLDICYFNKTKIEKIIKELENYSPFFSRWVHKAHTHELLKEKYVFDILRIIKLLQTYNVKNGFFFTGLTHHLDSLCFEIAFNNLGIKQIFLYPILESGRLIPFLQKNGFPTRKRFNKKISKFKYNELLKRIKNNKKVKQPRKLKQKFFNFLKTNYYFSFCYLVLRKLKHIIQGLLKLKNDKSNLNFKNYFSETLISDFELISNQRQYLKEYIKETKKYRIQKTKKTSLLIPAHFQPEATSFPMNGSIYSYLYIVSHLRSIGVRNKIFFKEHPATKFFIDGGDTMQFITSPSRVGINRNKRYLDELKKLNLVFLSMDNDLFDYKYFLPITFVGSIAFERSLNGLHTIYTGYPWWEGMPGAINLNKCNFDLNNIPKELVIPDKEIAKKSKEFLLNILNEKTLENCFNIGIVDKKIITNEFHSEFDLLLKKIETL